jgi:hypothetical protein
MNKLILMGLFFLLALSTQAQDIIIKKNGEELTDITVLRVEAVLIKYKSYLKQDGPEYSIPKSDVFMIKYENGIKEVFGNSTPQQNNDSASSPTTPKSAITNKNTDERIEFKNEKYYYHGYRISTKRVLNLINESGNQDAILKAHLYSIKKRGGRAMVIGGIPMLSIGGGFLFITTAVRVTNPGAQDDPLLRSFQIGSGLVTVGGSVLLIGGIATMRSSNMLLIDAVSAYNKGLE